MKIIKILSVVIMALIISNLYFTNNLVGRGEVINEITADIHEIEHENRKLEIQIAKKTSLTNLQEKISQAGFVDPENIATLEKPNPIALNN